MISPRKMFFLVVLGDVVWRCVEICSNVLDERHEDDHRFHRFVFLGCGLSSEPACN